VAWRRITTNVEATCRFLYGATTISSEYNTTGDWAVKGGLVTTAVGSTYTVKASTYQQSTEYAYWDVDEFMCGPAIVTLKGLLNGQKFILYKDGATVTASSPSAGGTCTAPLEASHVLLMPFNQITITDVDGSTIIYSKTFTSWTESIFGGDTFTATISSTVLKNPPPPLDDDEAVCNLMFATGKRVYPNLLADGEIVFPGAGSLGSFSIEIPDEDTMQGEKDFVKGQLCFFWGKVGIKSGLLFAGLVDRPNATRLPSGQWVVEVAGRSQGAFADMHGYSTTQNLTNTNPYSVIMDDTIGIKTLVPEMEFGNYVFSPTRTIPYLTIILSRTAWDSLTEEAMLSSTKLHRWAPYECLGLCLGETKPNFHFTEVTKQPSLVPVMSIRSHRVLSPTDFRQIITRAFTRYSYTYTYDADDTVITDSALTLKVTVP
jgi:hypothetical protein